VALTSGQQTAVPTALRALFDGAWYPADEVARGAAYELFSDAATPGFLPNPRPGAQHRFRRFVHASEVVSVTGGQPPHADPRVEHPLLMPVSRALDWAALHRMSQVPAVSGSPVAAVRCTATIGRGTRMVKVLSAHQLVGHLHGWLPAGFCYREYDIAHLRTPTDLAVLRGDGEDDTTVVFALRWRAMDQGDYVIPSLETHPGLVEMPPHDRIGPPVIGSGFAPADRHLIPEFVTADLADLPMPANASLVAYTPDGSEVTLYTYLPEQRAWTRMFGPQWRHLMPPSFPADQELFPLPPSLTRFIGTYKGERYEAIADPPDEFRLAAKTRAARYPVDSVARRVPYAHWRQALCTIVRSEAGWLRVRLCRPDGENIERLGAHCVERGIYETWAPAHDVMDVREVDVPYDLPRAG
jgi:hypothetical protein